MTLPANLTEALNSLGEAARELTAETRADRRERARRDRVTLALLGLVAVLVVALVTLGLVNRQTNIQNREIIEQIGDCTTVGGQCYERGQARTDDAIGRLVRAQVLLEVCARQPGTDTAAELEACVQERLAAQPD